MYSFRLPMRLFVLGVLVAGASTTMSQEPVATPEKPTVEELLKKLVEQDSRLKALEAELRAVPMPQDQTHSSAGASQETAEQQPDEFQSRLKKLEDSYKKDKDAVAKQKEDEAKKKKEAEEEGFAVGSDLKLNARWNQFNGFTAETPNKDFRIHIGGRFNYDSVWWTQDPFLLPANQIGAFSDGSFFRRARVQMDGSFWEVFEFAMEYQFEQVSDNIPNFDEIFVGITKVPALGTVRAGHLKIPQGLESLSSSKVLTFLERSPVFDAFWIEFGPGALVTNNYFDERATTSGMFYRVERANEGADFGDGEYAATVRATALPYFENEGRCLLHLGASATWRHAERPDPSTSGPSRVQFRARPSMRDAIGAFGSGGLPGNSNRIINTGFINADDAYIYSGELLGILGPLSLQSEVALAQVSNSQIGTRNIGDLDYWGAYVTLSYFLTGENRAYDRRLGRLASNYVSRINTPFWAVRSEDGGLDFGVGAWELAARYAYVDLNDDPVNGGKLSELTLGLNWYLTYNFKLQFQYLNAHRYDVGVNANGGFTVPQRSGDLQGFGIRTVLEF